MTKCGPERKRKVLTVDDNKVNLTLLQVHLSRMDLEVLSADNAADAIELAQTHQPDLILMDIMMPDVDGHEACRRLKADESTADIPIIFLSAKDQTADKVGGLQMGAVDYITKPFDPGELKARISLVIQMITLQEELRRRADTDELTGLVNRRRFREILEREVLRAGSHGTSLAVVMADLDHFKNINDVYGHLGGDAVLRQTARLLRETVAQHKMDVVGRYGGEEFIIVMPETNLEQAIIAAERIRTTVAEATWRISAEPLSVTMSAGVAASKPGEAVDADDLVRRADTALYVAKHRGRNRVVSDEELQNADRAKCHVSELVIQMKRLGQELRTQALKSLATQMAGPHNQISGAENHRKSVAGYVQAIASVLTLDRGYLDALLIAAELHDIGKLALPKHLQNAAAEELNLDERLLVQQHPILAVQVLEPVGVFQHEIPIIRHHHERYDGAGYPDSLTGKEIPFGARILAVGNAFANVVERWRSDEALSVQTVMQKLYVDPGAYDPEVLQACEEAAQFHAESWGLQVAPPQTELETVTSD